jgi:hypothetical protein
MYQLCHKSLYFFDKENLVRIICFKIITNTLFDQIIIALIILSSVHLIYDTFLDVSSDPKLINLSDSLNIIFTSLFTLESIIKIIGTLNHFNIKYLLKIIFIL